MFHEVRETAPDVILVRELLRQDEVNKLRDDVPRIARPIGEVLRDTSQICLTGLQQPIQSSFPASVPSILVPSWLGGVLPQPITLSVAAGRPDQRSLRTVE